MHPSEWVALSRHISLSFPWIANTLTQSFWLPRNTLNLMFLTNLVQNFPSENCAMTLFTPETLAAAKNAGLPITVAVGVLSIFAALTVLNNKLNLRALLLTTTFAGISILCLMFVFWLSTREIYQWIDTRAFGDWAGNDEGWTDGDQPKAELCDRSRQGVIATCWRNRREGYPSQAMFKGSDGTGAWCTYKLSEKVQLSQGDGKATGRVFICGRVSL
jgi:hypothetical protein